MQYYDLNHILLFKIARILQYQKNHLNNKNTTG
jgi:hypothetical protein